MLDWDRLRIFLAVAKAASFTRAADELHLSQPAISRQIAALEEDVQHSLFHRHARGLVLTEQGDILYRAVKQMYERLSAAEDALLESRDKPRGPLTVTAPAAIGATWLAPALHEFCEEYPDIQLRVRIEDRELDLTRREADLGIRLYPARHPDLIQKQLLTLRNSAYASEQYLQKYGVPQNASELPSHRFIAYGDDAHPPFEGVNWLLDLAQKYSPERQLTPTLAINSLVGMMRAVESGAGISGLPDYMARANPQLVRILPNIDGPTTDVYFVYPLELRNSKRVAAFRSFILRKLIEFGLHGEPVLEALRKRSAS